MITMTIFINASASYAVTLVIDTISRHSFKHLVILFIISYITLHQRLEAVEDIGASEVACQLPAPASASLALFHTLHQDCDILFMVLS